MCNPFGSCGQRFWAVPSNVRLAGTKGSGTKRVGTYGAGTKWAGTKGLGLRALSFLRLMQN